MHWKVHFCWIETSDNAESGSGREHSNSTARWTTCFVTSMDFGRRWRFNRFSIAKLRRGKVSKKTKLHASKNSNSAVLCHTCTSCILYKILFCRRCLHSVISRPIHTFAQKCSLCEKLEKFCLLCMRSIVEARALKAKVKDDIGGVGLMLRFAWRGRVVCEGADMHFKCNSLTVEGFFEAIPCLLWPMLGFSPFLTRRLEGAKNPIANCNFSAYVHARLTQTAAVTFMCSQLIEKSIAKVHFTQKLHFAHKKSSFLSKRRCFYVNSVQHINPASSPVPSLSACSEPFKMGRSLDASWSAFTPSGSVSHCSCNCCP